MTIAVGISAIRPAVLRPVHLSVVSDPAISNPPKFLFELPRGVAFAANIYEVQAGDFIELYIWQGNAAATQFDSDALTNYDIINCSCNFSLSGTTFSTGETLAQCRLRRDGAETLYGAWSEVATFTMPATSDHDFEYKLLMSVGNGQFGLFPSVNARFYQRQKIKMTISGADQDEDDFNPLISGNARLDSDFNVTTTVDCTAIFWFQHLIPSTRDFAYAVDLSGVEYTLDWQQGEAVTGISNSNNFTNISEDLPNNKATLEFDVGSEGFTGNVTLKFDVDENQGDGSPPINPRLYKTAHAGIIDTKLLDPDWKNYNAPFSIVRQMGGLSQANNAEAIDYADFADSNWPIWDTAHASSTSLLNGRKLPPPVAAIIENAEDTGTPNWVTLPAKISDAAVQTYAEALRDGTTTPIYFELSNEGWNNGFTQYDYFTDQGQLSGSPFSAHSSHRSGREWHGYRASRIFDIIRTAYGEGSGQGRWFGVLAGQAADDTVIGWMLDGLDYYLANEAASGTVDTDLVSILSLANYIGNAITSVAPGAQGNKGYRLAQAAAKGQGYFDDFCATVHGDNTTADLEGATGWVNLYANSVRFAAHKTHADARGMTILPYEGGWHLITGTPLQTPDHPLVDMMYHFTRSHKATLVLEQLFTMIQDTYGYKPMQFTLCSPNAASGYWGMEQLNIGVGDINPRSNMCRAFNYGLPYRQDYRPNLGILN